MTGLKRDFHFNDTPPLPPFRSFRCFNQRGGGGEWGEVQLYGERKLEQKGPIKEWGEIKRPINRRWATGESGETTQRVQNLYVNDSLSSWFTFVNYDQRERSKNNEWNKIRDKREGSFVQFSNRENSFFLSSDPFQPSIEATLIIRCSKSGKHFWRKGDTLISERNLLLFQMYPTLQSNRIGGFRRNFSIFPFFFSLLQTSWNGRNGRRTNFLLVIPNKRTSIKRTSKHVYDQENLDKTWPFLEKERESKEERKLIPDSSPTFDLILYLLVPRAIFKWSTAVVSSAYNPPLPPLSSHFSVLHILCCSPPRRVQEEGIRGSLVAR